MIGRIRIRYANRGRIGSQQSGGRVVVVVRI